MLKHSLEAPAAAIWMFPARKFSAILVMPLCLYIRTSVGFASLSPHNCKARTCVAVTRRASLLMHGLVVTRESTWWQVFALRLCFLSLDVHDSGVRVSRQKDVDSRAMIGWVMRGYGYWVYRAGTSCQLRKSIYLRVVHWDGVPAHGNDCSVHGAALYSVDFAFFFAHKVYSRFKKRFKKSAKEQFFFLHKSMSSSMPTSAPTK